MNKEMKVLWIVVVIVAVISLYGLFFGKTINQIINNPLSGIASPYDIGPELGINGVNQVVVAGDFKNATTTFVGFENPLDATSTVDLVLLKNTGVATSSYVITCGSDTLPANEPAIDLLTSDTIATSSNFFLISNDMTSSHGIGVYGGGTVDKIVIGPDQWFNCFATVDSTVSGADSAFTSAVNSFDGKFWVRFVRAAGY